MIKSNSTSPSWNGRLWLDRGMVAYMGPGGSAETHSHHAIQLIRSFDAPFVLKIGDTSFEARGALIPSGIAHSFGSDAGRLFLALIEPLGPRG